MKLRGKKLNVKSIVILTLILPVVVIALSSVAIVITAGSASQQQTVDINKFYSSDSAVQIPTSADEALELIKKSVNDAVSSEILKFDGNISVKFDNVRTSDNENIGNILSFASSQFEEKCRETFETYSIKYGENASRINEILPNNTPDEFTAVSDGDKITVAIVYSTVYDNMYFINDDMTAIKMFSLSNKSVFSSVNEKLVPTGFTYTLELSRENAHIENLTVERKYAYSSYITFFNTLTALGSTSLEFEPVIKEEYSFSYAGIDIVQDRITLEKNVYETLDISVFTEENLSEDEYSLEFISSDPDSVSVDENGRVSFVDFSDKAVTVEVKLTYIGKVFTDVCTVYAVKEVERVDVDKEEITLKKGESTALGASVVPNDATVKTVLYFSSDESVASVDSEGVITAVGTGTAVIYAVSVQSLTAGECTVNVIS